MPTFKVSVEWMVCATVEVEAESLDDAICKVEDDDDDDFPLPTDPDYVEGSLMANYQITQYLNGGDYNI